MAGLTPALLLRAYAAGVFPMAESADDPDVFWVEPEQRGIIPLDRFHVPHKLRRVLRHGPFEVKCDTDFPAVMRGCAAATPTRPSTWINDEIVTVYTALHDAGFAHSVETWQDNVLVGGLYGLSLNGAFFGESMFTTVTDASKVALVHLVARLIASGYKLLDTQFITDHLQRFGAIEIPRADYRGRLSQAMTAPVRFQPDFLGDVLTVVQSTTQIS